MGVETVTRRALCSGNLEVRLAGNADEIAAAQALRYRVFYDEMGAKPTAAMAAVARDFDDFDEACDHLLVIDHQRGPGGPGVVGTYRLMRREQADGIGRYYTAGEYDISAIVAHPGRILELGRSCVDPAHRNKPTMQMLWRGIAAYVFEHDIEVMFGCASLPGTDPEMLAIELSYLYHRHLAPTELRPVALPQHYTDMRRVAAADLDPRRAVAALPPLIKGYLRLGGFVGDGAVVDHQFNTTDVCVIVKTDQMADKYVRHYDRTTREF